MLLLIIVCRIENAVKFDVLQLLLRDVLQLLLRFHSRIVFGQQLVNLFYFARIKRSLKQTSQNFEL